MALPRRAGGSKLALPKEPEEAINEKITAPEVRCIIAKPEGDEMIGVLELQKAQDLAQSMSLDLVLVSPNAEPPVCKIIDYGKYRYQVEKKEKDRKKGNTSTASEIKEVKMSYKIDKHDYDVRLKSAVKFLEKGNRVKVMVEFKGREKMHIDVGEALLQKILEEVSHLAIADRPKMEGNRLGVIINPRPTK